MISVIIPTYNEEDHIKTTIQKVWQYDTANLISEIIIADGGSTDKTREVAASEGVSVISCPLKGRSAQMNYGAACASQEVLYFLHGDTIPPKGFSTDIANALANGKDAGCYMLSFDHSHWFLKANCWFTRFDVNAFRYGDQTLFVHRKLFEKIGGFCEKHIVFEDYHIIRRLKQNASFTVHKKPVITSARKYLENGIYKMQTIFYLMYFLYRLGLSQERLVTIYKKLIRQNKI